MVTKRKINLFFNAVQRGDLKKVVVFLSTYGSQMNTGPDAFDINTKNSHGNTAIFLAACRRDSYMYEILIAFGADPTIKCFEGRTALSIMQQDQDMCKILNNRRVCAANASCTEGGMNREEGFLLAVDNRDIREIATKLVKNACFYLNVQNENGDAPIHIATHKNDFCLVELLIAFGTNLNIQNNQGRTPLFFAINNEKITMVILLLDKGARQDIADNENNLPIHIAFKKSHYMVKLLLKQPSAKNIVNNKNYCIPDDDGLDLEDSDSKTLFNFADSRKRSIPYDYLPVKYRILEPINETNNNLKEMFPLNSLKNMCKQFLINKSTDFLVFTCNTESRVNLELGEEPLNPVLNNNLLDYEPPVVFFSSSNSSSSTPESSISVCSFISTPVSPNRYTPLVVPYSPPRSAPASLRHQ